LSGVTPLAPSDSWDLLWNLADPYMILGQLAYFVRTKLAFEDVPRVRAALDALLRTDVDLKSSGCSAVLLERLVVELCSSEPARAR
jgi:hypothetical protein